MEKAKVKLPKEEKNLNQNNDNAWTEITSNVGKVIQEIIDDKT